MALTRTIYGQKIYVDTRDMSLAPHILMGGHWEPWITKVFIDLVRPGMSVVDIGANVGWYSLLAGAAIGPSGHLTSFEANPRLADLLHRSLAVNGLLDDSVVEPKAVYSETKMLDFKIYDRFMGGSGLFASEGGADHFRDHVTAIQVQAVALDDYFKPGSKVDFIKIDAEGAEPFILQGARRVLSDNRKIVIMMEFSSGSIASSYGSIEKFHADMSALGFSIWRIDYHSKLIPMTPQDLSSAPLCDLVLKR